MLTGTQRTIKEKLTEAIHLIEEAYDLTNTDEPTQETYVALSRLGETIDVLTSMCK